MSEPDDVLSRQVAITARVDATGVSLQAKSRAVAALDRLIGSLADLPAAYVEGKANKRRLKDQIDRRLLEVQAEVAERKLRGMEQAGDALLVDALKAAGRKQANSACVAIEAIEEMKALPPPTMAQPGDMADEPAAVDEDWMNQFSRYTEDASSDQLQQTWGRVLAREVNRPGSFSRHTLRFVAELDRTTAEHCEFAMELAIGDFIPKTEAWNASSHLMIGLDLQRLGLLEGIGGLGGMSQTFEFGGEPMSFVKGQQLMVVSGQQGAQLSVPAIVVTRLGQEVFSLLTPSRPADALRELAGLLEKGDVVKRIELGPWVTEGDGLRYFAQEVLLDR